MLQRGAQAPLRFATVFFILFLSIICRASGQLVPGPQIFPTPQEARATNESFTLDGNAVIVVPENPREADMRLAMLLVKELGDKYDNPIRIIKADTIPQNRKVIVMGSLENILVKQYCAAHKITLTRESPGPEGYVLRAGNREVVICGMEDRGAFYGFQSLRQLIRSGHGSQIQGMAIKDWPRFPFRAVRLYVPGPENVPFFKRFLSDFMALYKYNKVIIEFNCMRLDRHPEVNTGWIRFVKHMQYTRSNATQGPKGEEKNSSHYDAGDGYIIEKDMVKDLVAVARENFLEVIPEIPSLTHAYYLLANHHELAEYPGDPWPDTYCPSNPESYKLMFDVYDEYLDVIQPNMVHIGHDEWWGAPIGVCPRCIGKDYGVLFANDVVRLHDYFRKKGISVAMWGDYLLESVRGKGPQNRISSTGVHYQAPGALPLSLTAQKIPKDILVFNWFWGDQKNETRLDSLGFQQVFGNFTQNISDWDQRTKKINLAGGAPSSWAATTEFNIGKDLIMDFLGCANLLWSDHTISQLQLQPIVWQQLPFIRASLGNKRMPGEDAGTSDTVDISSFYNTPANATVLGVRLQGLQPGIIAAGAGKFVLSAPSLPGNSLVAVCSNGNEKSGLPDKVLGIPVHEDVSSLIFLQASALPAANQKAYFNIPDNFDSPDLLGWYEIVYEDGYKITVPVQYGVNILEWDPGGENSLDTREGDTGSPQNAYCYESDAVLCSTNGSTPVFYAYEWVNKRFGKPVKEINLYGSKGYQALEQDYGKVTTSAMKPNAILLAAISKVKKRMPAKPSSE